MHTHYLYIYIYIYRSWVKITLSVILSNSRLPHNLLLTSYFENSPIRLYVLYVLNMHTNFHINRM